MARSQRKKIGKKNLEYGQEPKKLGQKNMARTQQPTNQTTTDRHLHQMVSESFFALDID